MIPRRSLAEPGRSSVWSSACTGEPLTEEIVHRNGRTAVRSQRKTDGAGIAHLFTPEDVRQISLKIFNV